MTREGRGSRGLPPLGPEINHSRLMSREPPKLRSDLLFSRRERDGRTTFVVKDPAASQFFSLKDEERFIAAQLDGHTPLETIRRRVEEKYDVSLSQESLASFIKSLHHSNLLEAATGPAQPKRRSRLRGGLLSLRIKVLDPDALFTRLARRVRFCFTRGFVTWTLALIALACIVAVGNWDALRFDLTRLIRWEALAWLIPAMFAVSTAHEFAHGLTCKHFGGEVRELGLLLMYLQPAFYCNVSDAWLLPEKRKRLWIGFAGPYLELFVWTCAVLVWRLTDPESLLNYGALAVIATSGFKTLMNFNPLIKLDGYYLLCDLLETPNLRQRAYAYVGNAIRRLLGSGADEPDELSRRERRIYLAYGLVASVFSVSLLGFALVKLGGFLIDKQLTGTAFLATGLLGLKFGRRFKRLFGKTSDPSASDDISIAEPSGESDGASDESSPAAKRKKPGGLNRRAVVVALLAGIGLPLAFLCRMQLRISGPFMVLPIHNADVRAEVGGTIEEIFVDEGAAVRKGDPIARLSDRDNRAVLERTVAEMEQLRAQIRLLEAGPRPQEIELARIAVARAEERARFMQKNLERDKQLVQDQLLARKDFDASQQAVLDSKNDIADAKKRLELLLAGSRLEDIEAAKAGLARLETQRRYVEEQLAHVKVVSPAAGIVTTPSRELKEKIGLVVKEGDLIAKVHELDSVEVETPVSERDIADIKVGQKVALKARAYPERMFFGTVTSIGTTAQIGTPAQFAASGASTSSTSASTSSSSGAS